MLPENVTLPILIGFTAAGFGAALAGLVAAAVSAAGARAVVVCCAGLYVCIANSRENAPTKVNGPVSTICGSGWASLVKSIGRSEWGRLIRSIRRSKVNSLVRFILILIFCSLSYGWFLGTRHLSQRFACPP